MPLLLFGVMAIALSALFTLGGSGGTRRRLTRERSLTISRRTLKVGDYVQYYQTSDKRVIKGYVEAMNDGYVMVKDDKTSKVHRGVREQDVTYLHEDRRLKPGQAVQFKNKEGTVFDINGDTVYVRIPKKDGTGGEIHTIKNPEPGVLKMVAKPGHVITFLSKKDDTTSKLVGYVQRIDNNAKNYHYVVQSIDSWIYHLDEKDIQCNQYIIENENPDEWNTATNMASTFFDKERAETAAEPAIDERTSPVSVPEPVRKGESISTRPRSKSGLLPSRRQENISTSPVEVRPRSKSVRSGPPPRFVNGKNISTSPVEVRPRSNSEPLPEREPISTPSRLRSGSTASK